MKTITVQQIRETLIRYVRDENLASGRTRAGERPESASVKVAAGMPAIPPPSTRLERLKQFVRGIPLLSPILVTAYRVIKLPGRIALIVSQLQTIHEQQARLLTLHDRVDALSWHVAALQERQEGAHRKTDTVAMHVQTIEVDLARIANSVDATAMQSWSQLDRIESGLRDSKSALVQTHGQLSDSAQVLVALHEKVDRYQQDLHERFKSIKPVISGGDNLIISRVDDFIMAFPAEEWRLPVYQILVGQLEPGLASLMKSKIREGMVVVDIGANVGTYTLLALQRIGTSGRVISYEPTPRVFDILKNNVWINGYIEGGQADLRQKAASDGSQDHGQFFISSNSLMNSLYGEDTSSTRPVQVIEVETVSLDQDLADIPRIDVVKIDTEGAEPMILRGMHRIIERSPGITCFIEFAPSHLIRAKVDMREFLAEIRSLGFQIQEVVEPTGELRATTDEALCSCFSVNLMLSRAS
jgi:FkbM family methyltransferase